MEDIESRNIILNGNIDEFIIEPVISRILEINEIDDYLEETIVAFEREPIKLYINSFGGSGHDMLALIGIMKTSDTPVYTIVLGKAMSAGYIIAMCGHRRFCHRYSQFMVHGGKTGGYGRASDIRDIADSLDAQDAHVRELLEEHTDFPVDKYVKLCNSGKDFYFGAREAIKFKFVDEVIE